MLLGLGWEAKIQASLHWEKEVRFVPARPDSRKATESQYQATGALSGLPTTCSPVVVLMGQRKSGVEDGASLSSWQRRHKAGTGQQGEKLPKRGANI